MKLSVFIIAHNEADRIARTLKAVAGLSDDVVVVDSGSTDGTQVICEQLGARVVFNAWAGYGAQKRFGEEQCQHSWVLNLDADEVLTPALRQEIQSLDYKKSCYEMQFQDAYPSEKTVAPFTYKKKFVRLYNKDVMRFSKSPVHDTVDTGEQMIGKLKNVCLHYSFRNLHHAIDKTNGYTSAQAKDMLARGKSVSRLRLILEFPLAFIKIYFLRRMIFRGLEGYIYSITYAHGRISRLAKVYEAQKCR